MRSHPALGSALVLCAAFASTASARVSICHKEGNGSYHVISVADSAAPAHLGHGDVPQGTFYRDADNDGLGNAAVTATCPGAGFVSNALDCDDSNAQVGQCGACIDLHEHCDSGSFVFQTICGAGGVPIRQGTPESTSYVTFGPGVTSVRLVNCDGRTLDLVQSTSLCDLPGGCCDAGRWNDEICAILINP